MNYTLGSLFDGSGGFPLAGSMCGFTPLWAAEVEPYPIAVTRSRFPEMRHLGDISKINGAEIPPVDVITFGSPCQDLSVAGKRAGLKHEDNGDEETTRSGLFMEAVRIIKEMREATHGRYPTFALWENVPGAFSSNRGEDFRIVLEELIKIAEPCATVPPAPKSGWPYADTYMGAGWSLAYRVFDAQHWGVPQRRRRIHLVVDFGGERAREILFEREGVRGYFAEGRTPWKATARNAENCPGADSQRAGSGVTPVCMATQQGGEEIRTDDKAPTITAAAGMSGNNQPVVCYPNVAHALTARHDGSPQPDKGNGANIVVQAAGFKVGQSMAGGIGWKEDTCYTLNTIDRPAVAYAEEPVSLLGDHVSGTLMARDYKGIGRWDTLGSAVCIPTPVRYIVRRLTPTECARLQGFPDLWGHPDYKENFTDEEWTFWAVVRNTHAAINGKATKSYTREQMVKWYNGLHTDSAEYKMWGNGIALPPALYCMQGIEDALEGGRRDG